MSVVRVEGPRFMKLDGGGVTVSVWESDFVGGSGRYSRFIGDTRHTADGKMAVWLHTGTPDAQGRDMRLAGVYDTALAAEEALWEAAQ